MAVSLERVPICGSPFRVCVLSAVARLPAALAHQPCLLSERTEPRAMPPPVSAASCALVDDVLCVRRPLSRQPGERPPRHDVLHLFHSEQRTWAAHEIMGPALPARTALAGVDSVLFFFTHSGGPTAPIDGVFCADLDALRVSGEARRHRVHTSGEFPAAAEGYQVCTMRRGLGSATVWFLGGRDGQGRLLDDVHAYETGSATWSCAHSASRGARAPGEAPAAREGHSVVEFQQALWLFGGRAEGGCLADLHCLDAAGEAAEWRPAQPSGAPPAPRKQHSCVVLQPTGYMLVVGGVDDAERLLEDVAVLDLYGLSWSRLEAGRVARRGVFCGCVRGELLTFGGQEATGELSQQLGVLDLTTLLQRSCLEFKGNPAEYVSVRGQRPSLLSLRNAFTVEAWVLPRSFPPFATILSKAAPNWMTGFGLAKYGAGKGDLEEVNTVNFFLTPGYTTSKATAMIDAHVWSHVAGVYDGSSLKIYVNGALADSILTAKADKEEEIEALHVPKADLCIGAHPGKAAWDGMIDEVRVWNVARTDEQVRDAMAAPVPSNTPGLVGQWTFNEASGEVVVDSSGMRNHGAIEGALCRGVSMRMDRGMGSAAQQRIDDVAGAYAKWRLDFEQVRALRAALRRAARRAGTLTPSLPRPSLPLGPAGRPICRRTSARRPRRTSSSPAAPSSRSPGSSAISTDSRAPPGTTVKNQTERCNACEVRTSGLRRRLGAGAALAARGCGIRCRCRPNAAGRARPRPRRPRSARRPRAAPERARCRRRPRPRPRPAAAAARARPPT